MTSKPRRLWIKRSEDTAAPGDCWALASKIADLLAKLEYASISLFVKWPPHRVPGRITTWRDSFGPSGDRRIGRREVCNRE